MARSETPPSNACRRSSTGPSWIGRSCFARAPRLMGARKRMATAVTVRRAAPADMSAVGQLGALLVRLHHEFDAARFIAASAGTAKGYGAYLGTQLQEANVVILVAESDGDVIGYTYAGVEGWDYMALRGPAGGLFDNVVGPARRGQGVGREDLPATQAGLAARGGPRRRVPPPR